MQPDRVFEDLLDILNDRAPAEGARFVLYRKGFHDHRERRTFDSLKAILRISPGHTTDIFAIRLLDFSETRPTEKLWEEHWKLHIELGSELSETVGTSGGNLTISQLLTSYEASSEIPVHHHFGSGNDLRHEATTSASLRHFWRVALAALEQRKDFAEMGRAKSKCAFCYPEIVGLDSGQF